MKIVNNPTTSSVPVGEKKRNPYIFPALAIIFVGFTLFSGGFSHLAFIKAGGQLFSILVVYGIYRLIKLAIGKKD